jgi:hypothetical protein
MLYYARFSKQIQTMFAATSSQVTPILLLTQSEKFRKGRCTDGNLSYLGPFSAEILVTWYD